MVIARAPLSYPYLRLFQSANKRNKLTFIAEPLDDGLAEKLENGKVNINWDNRKVRRDDGLCIATMFLVMLIASLDDCIHAVGQVFSNKV